MTIFFKYFKQLLLIGIKKKLINLVGGFQHLKKKVK
jgi:hypothetical protein